MRLRRRKVCKRAQVRNQESSSIISTSCVYPDCEKSLSSREEHAGEQEIQARGQRPPKHPRYQEVSGMECSRVCGSMGSSVAPVQRSACMGRVLCPDPKNFLEMCSPHPYLVLISQGSSVSEM